MVSQSTNAGHPPRIAARRFPMLAGLFLALALLALPAAVVAHETRTAGPWRLQVGWLYEPVWAGEINAIEVVVNEARSGQPVDGLQEGMSLEARVGPVTRRLEVRPFPQRPGHYLADIIPTRPGDLTVILTITSGSDAIRETFVSGPGRFEPVSPRTAIEVPGGTAGPGEFPAWLPGTVLGGLALAGVAGLWLRGRRP